MYGEKKQPQGWMENKLEGKRGYTHFLLLLNFPPASYNMKPQEKNVLVLRVQPDFNHLDFIRICNNLESE